MNRLLDADAAKFLWPCCAIPRSSASSDDHFSVDGTLVEAWATKSLRANDGDDEPPSRRNGELPARRAPTTRSTTDRMRLSQGNGTLMEKRNGLVVRIWARPLAPRTAIAGIRPHHARCRQGYDASSFVQDLRQTDVTPHIVRNR